MINIYRTILIGTALFLGISFTWIIGSFALGVEPESYEDTDIFIYFFMVMILITPLWLVLLLPKHRVKTIEFFRISGIVQLVILIYFFINSLIHQINHLLFTNFSFIIMTLLLCASSVSLYILVYKIKLYIKCNIEPILQTD